MYGDAKFRRFSRPQPNAQSLWIYLLTGPHTTPIPGVIPIGEMAMSESLQWPLEAFREAFTEVLREGMVEADWEARLVFVPKAVLYNRPESPNVVKSWASYWDFIPECLLKDKIHQHLKDYLEGLSLAFRLAFTESGTGTGAGTGAGERSPKKASQKNGKALNHRIQNIDKIIADGLKGEVS